MTSDGTVFSQCGRYRYRLQRGTAPRLAFVMLNPSMADATRDDPTIRRCIAFAKREGYAGITVCNVYAWRATKPRELRGVDDLFGENVSHLRALASSHPHIVVAWGANAKGWDALGVCEILEERACKLSCFGVTKSGQPKHPLFIAGDTPLRPYDAVNPWAAA